MSSEISPKKFSTLYRFYKTMVVKVEGKEILVANGNRIFDPSKPSIICLHGSGLDHTCWLAVVNKLNLEKYNFLIPDFPGHGYSEGSSLESIKAQSDWLEKFINAVQCKSPILMGHSQGGLVALSYCINSKNVEKLILINSSNKIKVHPDLIKLAKENDPKAVDLMLKWAYSGHTKSYTTEKVAKKVLNFRELSKTLAVDFVACDSGEIDEVELKKINVPTLIIASSNDKMIPANISTKLSEFIPKSSVEQIEETGHMILLEDFNEVGDIVSKFI